MNRFLYLIRSCIDEVSPLILFWNDRKDGTKKVIATLEETAWLRECRWHLAEEILRQLKYYLEANMVLDFPEN